MTVSPREFWSLLEQSELLGSDRVQDLRQEYAGLKGASTATTTSLAAWLCSRGVTTSYQNTVLLAGRAGPFDYGPYRVEDRVTHGALNGVFAGRHRDSNHPVFLRFLTGEYLRDDGLWREVVRRTADWSVRAERHVVQYYDAQTLKRHRFVVLERLAGGTLHECLQRGPISTQHAAHIGRLAALGLGALHRSGKCHGRVSPHSIWLCSDGNVKWLVDPTDDHVSLDSPRVREELADYAAPELWSGGVSGVTDIYGLGCVLYHALAGRPPFSGTDLAAKQRLHATTPIDPIAGVDDALLKAIAFLMAKNPQVRTATGGEAAKRLEPWVEPRSRDFRPPVSPRSEGEMRRILRDAPKNRSLPSQPPPDAAGPGAKVPRTKSAVRSADSIVKPVDVSPPEPAQASRPIPVPPAKSPAAAGKVATETTAPKALAGLALRPTPPVASVVDVPSVAPESARAPIRRRPVNSFAYLAKQSLMGAAAALVLGGAAYLLSLPREEVEDPAPASPPRLITRRASDDGNRRGKSPAPGRDPDSASGNGAAPASAIAITDNDDGKSLWAPPRQGEPISLRWSPSPVLAVLTLRPEIFASEEGARLFQALGPGFQQWRATWEESSGVTMGEVDELLCTWRPAGPAPPRPAFVVTLQSALPRAELLERLGGGFAAGESGDVAEHRGHGFLVPNSQGDVRTFVMASPQDIADIQERDGAEPPLRSAAERLLARSNRQLHINLLAFPHFLSSDAFRDGREYYFGPARRLREPMEWFLGDGLQAVLASVHVEPDGAFLELRAESELGLNAFDLADGLRSRAGETPERLEAYLASQLDPPRYWKAVAIRLPVMMRYLEKRIRAQAEGPHAVVNAYLPAVAAHNLAFAGEMLLATSPGAASESVAASDAPTVPQSLDALLQQPFSLAFPQMSLEAALKALAQDVKETYPSLPFPIEIKVIGNDLEKAGITRNKELPNFDQRNQTVATILTALMVTANPDPTEKGASDPNQKLVWAIGPNPDSPQQTVILITTREAAKANQYRLDPAFGETP